MRILILHSRYRSGSASGENRVVDDEAEALRQAGHDVDCWTPSVDRADGPRRMAANVVWSRTAAAEVHRLVSERRPDVLHVHSLYPRLSPSVIRAAAKLDVPIVATLHNFRLMCLPATFLRDAALCDACAGHAPWRGVVHGCYRNSRVASAAIASSLLVHRVAHTFDHVDLFLSVSDLVREKHVAHGFEPSRIRVKDNFCWPAERRRGPGEYFASIGRLSIEKGVDVAIGAVGDRADLVVVGDGPESARLRANASGRVTFVGAVDSARVSGYLARARAVLVPSRCYEGAPRSVIEAFAAGVPVIASRIGGLAELVEDDVNGILVADDDPAGWRSAVGRMLDDRESERLGRGAFSTWSRRFTPAHAVAQLEEAYAIARS